jgi:hypothetical protein
VSMAYDVPAFEHVLGGHATLVHVPIQNSYLGHSFDRLKLES